jgi:hypothetical protein
VRRREFFWSLYHTPEKNQVDDLRTDQVEAVYACLPARHREQWLIWRDGFQNWKPFAHFPQLLVSLRKVDARVPESAPAPPTEEEMIDAAEMGDAVQNVSEDTVRSPLGIGGVAQAKSSPRLPPSSGDPYESKKIVENPSGLFAPDLSLAPTAVGEDRGNNRFDKAVDVRIIAGDKTYTNQTVNISLKGMQFRTPLPKDLPRYFNVEIRYKGKIIPLVCAEVKNKDGSPANRARIEVNDYASALLAFLLGN